MDSNGLLKLLDVFGTALSEGSLGLPVPLLSFLGGGIDRLATTLPLGLLSFLRGSIEVIQGKALIVLWARAKRGLGVIAGSMTIEAVEVVMMVVVMVVTVVVIVVLRRIRLIDGHLVCHAFPRPGFRDDCRRARQTPQNDKTEILLRERGGTSETTTGADG